MPRHIITPDPDYAVELQSALKELEEHRSEITGIAQKLTIIDEIEETETAYSIASVDAIIQHAETTLQYGDESAIIISLAEARAALQTLTVKANVVPVISTFYDALEDGDMDELEEEITLLIKDMEARLEGEIAAQLAMILMWIEGVADGWGEEHDELLADLKAKFDIAASEYTTNNSLYVACCEEMVNSAVFGGVIPNLVNPADAALVPRALFHTIINTIVESGDYKNMTQRAIKQTMDTVRDYVDMQYAAISRWHERLTEITSALIAIDDDKRKFMHQEDDDIDVHIIDR